MNIYFSSILIALLFLFSCNSKDEHAHHNIFAPKVVEAKGYVVPKGSMAEPKVILVDESKLKKIPAGKPTVVPINTNVRPAGIPKTILAGIPTVVTLGQDTFSLPIRVPAIDSPFVAGIPEVVIAKDPAIKDENPQSFSSFNILQGLKSGTILCMLEDKNGNLWFGTGGGGVSKYDGESFTNFTEREGLSNTVVSLLEDKSGNLWFGTGGGGVSKYDGKSFTNFTEKEGLSGNTVVSILEDKSGNLWFGTEGGGVSRLSGGGKFFTHFTAKEGLSNDKVWSMLEDKNGNLWFGTDRGVSRLSQDGKSFTHFTKKEGLRNDIVRSMLEDKNGNLWFGTVGFITGGGVSQLSQDGKSFTYFTEKEGLNNNYVNAMLEDKSGNIWFGTDGGVSRLSRDGKSFTHFTEKEGLSSDVRSILEDKGGNLWFGTGGEGVSKYDGKSFTHFTKKEGLGNNVVASILEDKGGNLWFGTFGGGVSRLSRDRKSFANFTVNEGLSSNFVWSILEDKTGNLWFGTNGGVSRLSGDGKFFTHFTEKEGLSNNVVNSMIEDKSGNLWFGTFGGGVSRLSRDRRFFTHFTEKEGLSNNAVSSILEDKSGNFWFGTNGGVSRLSWDGKFFTHFTEKEGLSNNAVWSILEDKTGNLWFGTGGGGVSRLCVDRKFFTHFTEKEGLSSNYVSSMLEDKSGNLWFGTGFGISKLSKEKLKAISGKVMLTALGEGDILFKNFTYEDGFLGIGNAFDNSICEDKNGIIWVGTLDRLTAYHPEGEIADTIPPNIQLTTIELFNEKISWLQLENKKDTSFVLGNGVSVGDFEFDSLSKWYGLPENLSLAYNNNYLTFNFVGISQKAPKKVKYQYKLEGNDENWSAITTRSVAPYGNLPQGTYSFKVKAMNGEGYWSNEFNYRFTIRPPWWKTWWAYFLYSLALIAIFLYWRSYENSRLKLKHRAEHLSELDNLKTRFFANISHEFRTPITLILGPLKEMYNGTSKEDPKTVLGPVIRNGQRLLRLINQLLDLSKVEAGKMVLQTTQMDLVQFLKEIASSYESLATDKKIKYFFYPEVPEIMVYFDPEKIEKVVHNLLSNAFKFTKNGEVILYLKVEDKYAVINLKDTGIGIPAEELDKVFDRFYQVDSSQTRGYEGSGLGMALAKELVELHHGNISVESKEGKGTTFTVWLPLGNEHLSKDEIADSEGLKKSKIFSEEQIIPEDTIVVETETEKTTLTSEHPVVLIVEDNTDMRTYIRKTLAEYYHIIEAETGKVGVKKAEEIIPDLIISDIMMPEMDGYQLCEKIKNNEPTSHIPVILLTAKADQQSRLTGLEYHADDYLSKPFDADELRLIVRNHIEARRKMRERFSREITLEPAQISVSSLDEKFLQKVLALIEARMEDENFSIEDFSQEAGYSRMQFYRKIKALAGQTPSQFVRTIRLKRAAQLLSKKSDNVTQIAYSVGFSSLAYFNKCFKEQYGVTPGQYSEADHSNL